MQSNHHYNRFQHPHPKLISREVSTSLAHQVQHLISSIPYISLLISFLVIPAFFSQTTQCTSYFCSQ